MMLFATDRSAASCVVFHVGEVTDDEAGQVRYHGNRRLKRRRHQPVAVLPCRLFHNNIYTLYIIYYEVRLFTNAFHNSELDVGSNSLTHPDPTHSESDPSQPDPSKIVSIDPTRPILARIQN